MVIVSVSIGFTYLYLRHKEMPFLDKMAISSFFEEEEVKVRLYFSSFDASCLALEERKIKKCEDKIEQAKLMIKELIKGPLANNLKPTLPLNCQIKEVFSHKETIFVDFDQNFVEEHCKGSCGEILTIYSIVNTLLDNLNSYKKVQFLVEGKEIETLAGHIFLQQPLFKEKRLIKVETKRGK